MNIHLPTAPLHGDPGGIRTHDPPLRRRLLYPAELLSHTIWSGQPDSNWRPPAPKAGALPTALCPVTLKYFITCRPIRQEEIFGRNHIPQSFRDNGSFSRNQPYPGFLTPSYDPRLPLSHIPDIYFL